MSGQETNMRVFDLCNHVSCEVMTLLNTFNYRYSLSGCVEAPVKVCQVGKTEQKHTFRHFDSMMISVGASRSIEDFERYCRVFPT